MHVKPLMASFFAAALTAVAPAMAQSDFPNRPVTIVVPFSAGGPTDIVARALAAAMEKSLGATIVVDNKPGAGGTLGAADVARSKPDGYRVLVHHIGMSTAPTLYSKLGFNVEKDFEPVALINDVPMMFVTRADYPAKDFKAILDEIGTKGDKMTLANAGVGSASHLCGLMFLSRINKEMTTVPYKGTAPAITDLIGGQVDLLCDQSTNTTSFIEGGKVKAYAVAMPERLNTMKDVPTTAEAGLPGFAVSIWHAMYAPKGTPKAVVDKLAKAVQAGLKDEKLVREYTKLGAVIMPENQQNPEALRKHLKAEIERWKPVIEKAGVRAD